MIYLAKWSDNKNITWSGTTLSLMNALQKQTNLKSLEVKSPNLIKKLFFFILNLFLKRNYVKNINFNIFFLKHQEKNIIHDIENKDDDILQIGDLINDHNSSIYQDLSIGSLLFIKEHDIKAFNYSGFQNLPIENITERNSLQKTRYKKAKFIFTMSNWLRDFLISNEGYSEEKVIYVGAGINLSPNKIKPKKKNKKRILFVGKDFQRKGGDLVIESFKHLRNNYLPDAELYIAGPKDIGELKNIPGVHFIGPLSSEKLSEYFNLCDIFCMPSRFEAYGIVFAEALCYGLPCIARNKFEMKNIIHDGKNGLLIEDDNIEKLSEKMYTLLNDKNIYKNVYDNRNIYLDEYSWEKVAKRIMNKLVK
ncbi:glycosyltransferase family 4 protein [Oenococcus oeni]|uniref:glycosyltransferase family 4 protein n=1 Tax=Oenococcus oeni TaxID=1247 RepID=UPI0010B3B794|nr:glycosyltransferase family 4 protein [Oenococcus oeni]SYW15661.1 Lipopolysaccharide N-acetylglucosaminyltransferase [Oenococcus oeni]